MTNITFKSKSIYGYRIQSLTDIARIKATLKPIDVPAITTLLEFILDEPLRSVRGSCARVSLVSEDVNETSDTNFKFAFHNIFLIGFMIELCKRYCRNMFIWFF